VTDNSVFGLFGKNFLIPFIDALRAVPKQHAVPLCFHCWEIILNESITPLTIRYVLANLYKVTAAMNVSTVAKH